jgi:hypothetical protein
MNFYNCSTVEGIKALAESEFAAIARTLLQACPKISKRFAAYLEGLPGLVAVAP